MEHEEYNSNYGALDAYHIHFIVNISPANPSDLLVKCKPVTKGYFQNKKVIYLKWEGGRLSDRLSKDTELNNLIKELILQEDEIKIDPLDNCVRIYTKWKHIEELRFNPLLLKAMDIIAGHIKKINREI